MQRLFVIYYLFTILYGQILPTVPANVFRFSFGTNASESMWKFEEQNFELPGIGRHYFNNLTHNDSVRYSSNYDLYHNGSFILDSVNTIEQWLTNFNNEYGFSLPVYGAQLIDTSKAFIPKGTFLESRKKNIIGRSFKIEYGMSNDVTLSITMPIIDSYIIDQAITDFSITGMNGADVLINYHINAKSEFKSFRNSASYDNLRRGLRDTLNIIYDKFYNNSSEYNILWAMHAGIDPINNLLVDSRFIPAEIGKDTVSLTDLVNYYYPGQKTGSGVDDINLGATVLLRGKPSWSSEGKSNALYAKILVSIPFGKTLSSFKAIGSKQFKEAKIGSGVSRWSVGLYGTSGFKGSIKGRYYFQSSINFSTPEILNTSVSLFSGGHTNPDSIISQIGNTYKFDQGTGFLFISGSEIDVIPKQLRMRSHITFRYKGQDRFVSNNKMWDSWMQKHNGYNSANSRLGLVGELWFLNSISKYRFGLVPFDLYLGVNNWIFAKNTFDGWQVYTGITTYYQGW